MLHAFAENAFGLRMQRILGGILAKKVAALTMRMSVQGFNALQMAQAVMEELKLDNDLWEVMGLVVPWEDITSVQYDPAGKMFIGVGSNGGRCVPTITPQAPHGTPGLRVVL